MIFPSHMISFLFGVLIWDEFTKKINPCLQTHGSK